MAQIHATRRPSKLLFLDIDGVLVTDKPGLFHEHMLQRLRRIVDCTGCGVVLSSDWRRRKEGIAIVCQHLSKHGIPLLGITRPAEKDDARPEEIMDFVLDYRTEAELHAWVAIDDRDLLKERGGDALVNHFVKTRLIKGLTDDATQVYHAVTTHPPLIVFLSPGDDRHPVWQDEQC